VTGRPEIKLQRGNRETEPGEEARGLQKRGAPIVIHVPSSVGTLLDLSDLRWNQMIWFCGGDRRRVRRHGRHEANRRGVRTKP
jgi:hypothetical protein